MRSWHTPRTLRRLRKFSPWLVLGGWAEAAKRGTKPDSNNVEDIYFVKSFVNKENLEKARKVMILSGMKETKKARR